MPNVRRVVAEPFLSEFNWLLLSDIACAIQVAPRLWLVRVRRECTRAADTKALSRFGDLLEWLGRSCRGSLFQLVERWRLAKLQIAGPHFSRQRETWSCSLRSSRPIALRWRHAGSSKQGHLCIRHNGTSAYENRCSKQAQEREIRCCERCLLAMINITISAQAPMRLFEISQCVHHSYNEHESICQTSQSILTDPSCN